MKILDVEPSLRVVQNAASNNTDQRLMTIEALRDRLGGISRSTIMREIRRKRLGCYRIRRTLRFSEEQLQAYLKSVEVKPKS